MKDPNDASNLSSSLFIGTSVRISNSPLWCSWSNSHFHQSILQLYSMSMLPQLLLWESQLVSKTASVCSQLQPPTSRNLNRRSVGCHPSTANWLMKTVLKTINTKKGCKTQAHFYPHKKVKSKPQAFIPNFFFFCCKQVPHHRRAQQYWYENQTHNPELHVCPAWQQNFFFWLYYPLSTS